MLYVSNSPIKCIIDFYSTWWMYHAWIKYGNIQKYGQDPIDPAYNVCMLYELGFF